MQVCTFDSTLTGNPLSVPVTINMTVDTAISNEDIWNFRYEWNRH